jgi:glutathione reductase (NADPH)
LIESLEERQIRIKENMLSELFDFIVVGAGSGGVRAARWAAELGAKVAIVEERFLGGTCVNVGCVPKKLFAYGAELNQQAGLASTYGITQNSHFNWQVLRDNKTREIERLNGIYARLLSNAGVTLIEGHGRVTRVDDIKEVDVAGRRYQTRHLLLATGGKPFRPDTPGAGLAAISDDLFYLPELPEKAVVVGGGYIACEFSSILHGLGVEVTQLYRGDLFLRGFDEDIRHFVATRMAANGIDLRFNCDVAEIQSQQVMLKSGGNLAADKVFFATGRVAKLDALFDAGCQPELTAKGLIAVNEYFETSLPGVYALGDVVGHLPLTPVALAEGMWLANELFGEKNTAPMNYDLIPTAVFCQPNIATVGLTQEQALKRVGRLRIYRSEFRPLRYTLGSVNHRSLMKLIVDDTSDRVLGLHMAGDEAAEIMQGLAVAVKMGATKADFDRTIGIHPTSAEEWVTLREAEVVEA